MARRRSMHGDVDLRAFYAAGTMLRNALGRHLYDLATVSQTQHLLFAGNGRTLPFLYPAFAALPFVPLSLLPYPVTFIIVLLINLGCLFASANVLTSRYKVSGLSPWWLFGLLVSFFPTASALMQGQISCILLLCFVYVHVFTERGKHFLGGLCLSLALVKFQIVLPIALLYLLGRQFRVIGGFLTGGFVLALVSYLITGRAGARDYVSLLHGVSSTMLLQPAVARASFGMEAAAEPNIHGLVTTLAGAGGLGTFMILGCSLAVIGWTAQKKPMIATALPAAMLVSYHMQPYDLVLLLLPISVLIVTYLGCGVQQKAVSILLAISAAMLMFPIGPYILVNNKTVWLVLAIFAVLLASRHTFRDVDATFAPSYRWFRQQPRTAG